MDTHQKLALRELLLEQLLQETTLPHATQAGQLADFKHSLRLLAQAYSVVVVAAGSAAGEKLEGRFLQLRITPQEASSASMIIRVSGVLVTVDDAGGRLDFKPSSVDISRGDGAQGAFLGEVHGPLRLIAHVRHILKVLRHEDTATLALSA